MNESNLEYLKKSLDYLGFGTRLNEVLESPIRRELPKFSLGISQHYSPPGFRGMPSGVKDHMRFELNFSKSNESDMFFLNSYQAVLSKYDGAVPVTQVFDLERDHRMTALQAYRLLSGFSFEKEISLKTAGENSQPEKRPVWLKLNLGVTDSYGNHPLHHFYPEYNFDLEKSLEKYPFYLAGEDRKEKLIKELKNGGLSELEMMMDGKPLSVFVSAEPQFKTLNIYSRDMTRISDAQIFSQAQSGPAPQQGVEQSMLSSVATSGDKPWKQDEGVAFTPKPGR
ncbi:hypothetical protein [Pedobacter sp. Leaf194]|uniref:hypothetical protein n=1 Tax=Pedobacter sp. Leaf194 TaxID=1736297 RepID=UPI000703273A|nr:hypothetical protein [Pedobacter sp. Leaf194]KQS36147.1 hypothetical protein ASG14_11990 [Pedobacter sp. Leaf194]